MDQPFLSESISDSVPFLNLAFLEAMYADYILDQKSVSPEWRSYFDAIGHNGSAKPPVGRQPASIPAESTTPDLADAELSDVRGRLNELVHAFRSRGHLAARLDPLGSVRDGGIELDPSSYGFTQGDLDRSLPDGSYADGTVRTIGGFIHRLQSIYCGTVGIEFMHIDDATMREWVRERVEAKSANSLPSADEQLRILTLLTRAAVFEEYVRKKYVGSKSFSLEGSESLIPLLDFAIEQAGIDGADEVVLAMAHRGRLNVLVNIVGKRPQDVFREFQDEHTHEGHGDVKYHLGASSDRVLDSGHKIHLSLSFNPSHLEFINPVVCGRVRAKQDRVGDSDRRRGAAVQIHGDAAFTGQGTIQETLNLSLLPAYRIGGSLHVVVNNQIGFTTGPLEARSCRYATDVAKMLQIPIFHVNGDDPEAVIWVTKLVMEFRDQFARDVVIDLYGYRRLGHNEGDEPSYTQPLMYQAIAKHPSVRELYVHTLLRRGSITQGQSEKIAQEYQTHLDRELAIARSDIVEPPPAIHPGPWEGFHGGMASNAQEVDTSASQDLLVHILHKLTSLPDDFHLHPRLERLIERRAQMAGGTRPLDWATAEALAFGTLAMDGVPIRLTGQDAERGTFSQRHAVLHDVENENRFAPLSNLHDQQAPVLVANSPLSETGVMGFEYGYSLDFPNALVMWEAQYGDFVNAGQVIVDQFITSAEAKWRRWSGIVLLLPHGFDGQGPEHSSARLERFLVLAAEDNIQVANVTTPAQYFHLLRRQALRKWRKPLVIMTPKSLLRDPHAVSPLEHLSQGRFQPVLSHDHADPKAIRSVLLCSGKIYYELNAAREKSQRSDLAIVRLEQLYPLPLQPLELVLKSFPNAFKAAWVQEEPENMGVWRFLRSHFEKPLLDRLPLSVISRPRCATPAGGSPAQHKVQQTHIIHSALT